MTDLFNAYINNATIFAIIHGVLIVACFWIWIRASINLNAEKRALNKLKVSGLSNTQSASQSDVIKIAEFAAEFAKKGTVVDVEAVSRRLSRTLSGSDATLRAFINGLIVVGLLGTLFNLWHLSPTFWNSLLEGNQLQKDVAIGIAFAASFFGLLWSLALNLIDNLLFRRPREIFVQEAAGYIVLESIKQLPPTQEVAVVNALNNFVKTSETTIADLKKTSETIITDLKTQSADLTQTLVTQIDNSSKLLTSQFDKILRRWWRFFNDAASKVKEEEGQVIEATNKLVTATEQVSSTLERTTQTLQGYKELDELIAEVRTQTVNLVSQVTQQVGQLNEQTRVTITEVTKLHAETLAQESEETKRRLSDLMDAWHTKSAGILTPFGETMRKTGNDFSQDWQQLSNSLDGKIESQVDGWQTSLNNAVSEVKTSLTAINHQLKQAESLSEALLKSAEKLTQAAKNIPIVSEKTNGSDEYIREMFKKLETQFYQSNKLAGQLLDKLDTLPSQISQIISKNNKTYSRPVSENHKGTTKQYVQPNVGNIKSKPSFLKRWFG